MRHGRASSGPVCALPFRVASTTPLGTLIALAGLSEAPPPSLFAAPGGAEDLPAVTPLAHGETPPARAAVSEAQDHMDPTLLRAQMNRFNLFAHPTTSR
jgi:hypothetical protein